MLDIKFVRENQEFVAEAMASRNTSWDSARFSELEESRREAIQAEETLQAERNALSKKVGELMKAGQREEAEEVKARVAAIKAELEGLTARRAEVEADLNYMLMRVPNLPSDTTPVGKDENDNPEVRRWGTPRDFAAEGFEPKAHWDLGKELGILDPDTAAKVTGARFHFYRGMGSRLERAIINYFLDTHTDHGYTEIFPPYMVNRDSMRGTGQLPKFEEDAFRVANNDFFLIPTAEVPVTNMYRDDILDGTKLPLSFCAYSACFRAEAGSAGRDTRGLIRQHQFNKVELVKFTSPETSYEELEKLTNDAERVLQGLGLPYRVVRLSSGDLGFSSAMTYDIEVYMPSYGRYVEISSCSDFEDYQARRANIRFRETPKDKPRLVHTLNGSGVAVGRTVAAILENYQNEDGSVTVPEALRTYMGCDVIKPETL
ncbi:MAG: serine--tRNA ligase [Eggerthellaceae bacterium]|nr:serine--tRNA ligase [Eggerthellaceae bacterium]